MADHTTNSGNGSGPHLTNWGDTTMARTLVTAGPTQPLLSNEAQPATESADHPQGEKLKSVAARILDQIANSAVPVKPTTNTSVGQVPPSTGPAAPQQSNEASGPSNRAPSVQAGQAASPAVKRELDGPTEAELYAAAKKRKEDAEDAAFRAAGDEYVRTLQVHGTKLNAAAYEFIRQKQCRDDVDSGIASGYRGTVLAGRIPEDHYLYHYRNVWTYQHHGEAGDKLMLLGAFRMTDHNERMRIMYGPHFNMIRNWVFADDNDPEPCKVVKKFKQAVQPPPKPPKREPPADDDDDGIPIRAPLNLTGNGMPDKKFWTLLSLLTGSSMPNLARIQWAIGRSELTLYQARLTDREMCKNIARQWPEFARSLAMQWPQYAYKEEEEE